MADYPDPSSGEDPYSDADTTDTSRPEEDANGETATSLLPKAFFMGKTLEPGSRCEVEVVRVHDDQVEVSYVQHEAENETEQPLPEYDAEMAGMME